MRFEARRTGIGTGAVVAAVIVVVLIAAAGYFIFVPGNNSSSSTTTTSSSTTSTTSSTTTSSTTTSSTSSTTSTTSSTSSTSSTSTSSTTSPTTSSTSNTTSTTSGTTVTITIPQGAGAGKNFDPANQTIASGTTVTFVDQDSLAPHNVWFTSIPAGATNPNTAAGQSSFYQMIKGQSVSYTFTTPGQYVYQCQFHATWMTGVITVTA